MRDFELDLTNTEMEIMEVLWKLDKGISFKELLDYINENLNKQWKRQTLTTYLNGLQKLKLISFNGQRKSYLYYAACTREEYMHRRTRKLVEKSYENSLLEFISAFTGGEKLSKKDVGDLKKVIDQYSSAEE